MRWLIEKYKKGDVKSKDYRDRILDLEREFLNEEAKYLIKIRELKVNTANDISDIVEELFLAKHPKLAIGCTIHTTGKNSYKLLSVRFKFEKPHMIAVMTLQPIGIRSLPYLQEMHYYNFKVIDEPNNE